MNKLLAIIWGSIFLIGLVALTVRLFSPLKPCAVAARQVPVDHLILSADLQNSSQNDKFVGRYARSNIAPGQVLGVDDISSTPLLSTHRKPFFAVPTQRDLVNSGSIDVTTAGKLCNKDEIIGDAEVVALFCTMAQESPPCMALVSADPEIGPKLVPNETKFLTACPKTQPQK